MIQLWAMKIFFPFLPLLLCLFSSCQGQSSGLPPNEEETYKYLISSKFDWELPKVQFACDQTAYANTTITIKCGNSTVNPEEMNVISVTIRGLSTIWEFPRLSNFTHLQELVIESSLIEGPIPEYLGTLSHLTHLDISYNMLKGSIPKNLGRLHNLIDLSLSHNFLSGPIPETFADLRSLQRLDLSTNKLSGSIPKFMGKMANLTQINLGSNNFTGTLPPELGKLVNLTHLKVPSNSLSGSIPAEYAQLKKINQFSVAGNSLNGNIPEFIANWILLSRLELMGNNFEGIVPQGIFGLTGLQVLWVSNLTNSGFPFPSLAKLKSMKFLILRRCGLNGQIGNDIGDMSDLIHLDLSFNNLIGGIPDTLSDLTSLFDLSLAGNELNGAFPYWVVEDSRGLLADLSDNKLILNKTLGTQSLSQKNLFGCCSSYTNLSDGQSLVNMTSDPNQLMQSYCPRGKPKHDTLHINCGGDEKFQQYESDNSSSSVHVSSEGKWAYSCSGHFMASSPDSYAGYGLSFNGRGYTKKTTCSASPLFETARLCPVSLTYYGFCLHRGDYIVQLHFAEVVYNQDADYGSLKNRVFDVYIQDNLKISDLNIKDRAGAPNRPWNETFQVKVEDDSLLKIQLHWAGKGAITDDPLMNGPLISAITVTPAPKPKKLTPWQIVLIVLASIIFALLLMLAFSWKMGWLENKEWQETRIELRDGAFITVKDIIDYTQNFTQKKIGEGGFGIVYEVKAHNQVVAVKKLITDQSTTVASDFQDEIVALKSLEHENLIKFFDSFSRKDLHLLVYEFMENGSLDRALSGENSRIKLNWEIRCDICLGIAKGLKYMHNEEGLKIIHRDLKASNILLDRNLKAKVSDLGLAKIYDENNCVEKKAPGTHQYMAQEYASVGLYSDKTDVYSYGILLLEIMSGRSIVKETSSGQRDFLLDRAWELHKGGKLMELIDKKLKLALNQEQSQQMKEKKKEQADRILNLAMLCTNISAMGRPKMSEVVDVMEGKISYKTLMPKPSSWDYMCPHCNGVGVITPSTEEEDKGPQGEASEKSPLLG